MRTGANTGERLKALTGLDEIIRQFDHWYVQNVDNLTSDEATAMQKARITFHDFMVHHLIRP